MNKKIIKYSLFLLALGLIAGFLLGLVNSITAPIIESRAKEEAAKALREHYLYADYSANLYEDFYKEVKDFPNILELYVTFDQDGKAASVIYKTETYGFKSNITAFIEVKVDGKFGKIVILGHDESKGIGDVINTHDFGVTGSSIDNYTPVISSGATFSAKGVINAIKVAADNFKLIGNKVGGMTNE